MAKQTDEYELVFDGSDKGLARATDQVRAKLEGLAESENKVKRHLTGFVQDMSRATSGTQVLASSVYRLSEALKVGIAGGVVAGVMMQIKGGAEETTKQFDALALSMAELNKTENTSNYAKPVEKLKAEAEQARKQAAELNKQLNKIEDSGLGDKEFWQGAAQYVGDIVKGGKGGETMGEVRAILRNQIKTAGDIEGSATSEIIRREEMQERDMSLKIDEATGPASAQKSLNIRIERLKIAKEELHLAQNASVIDKQDIQQKTLSLRLAEQRLSELNAEAVLNSELLNIEERKTKERLGSSGATEKAYNLAKMTAEAAAAEAKAMEAKNVEQGKFLRLKAQEAAAVPAAMDEQLNKGKSAKDVRARIREQEKEQREAEKFRAKREKDEGMIPTKRDMQGRPIEGIDPVTGEKIVKERKWDKIFDKEKKDAAKDGAGAGQAVDKKRKEAAADAVAEKDQKKTDTKKLESLVEKSNTALGEMKKVLENMVAKR